jgi:hypothetical protein
MFTRSTLDYFLRVKCEVSRYVFVDYDGRGELLLLVPADKINLVEHVLHECAPCGVEIVIETMLPDVEEKLLNLCGSPRLNCRGELV